MKKKVELGNKLALNKETIAHLDEQELKAIAGGGTNQTLSCTTGGDAAEESDNDSEDFNSCCKTSCNTAAC